MCTFNYLHFTGERPTPQAGMTSVCTNQTAGYWAWHAHTRWSSQ